MSDDAQELIERLRAESQASLAYAYAMAREKVDTWPREAVVRVSFHATDAALQLFLEQEPNNPPYQRRDITPGSSHYTLTIPGYVQPLADMTIRAVGIERTYVAVTVNARLEQSDKQEDTLLVAWLINKLWLFINWLATDQQQMLELDTATLALIQEDSVQTIQPSSEFNQSLQKAMTPKRRGPAPAAYNTWAREQAQQGRTIDELLSEYMQRRGDDPSDEQARNKAREALRKTIERGKL